MIVGGCGQVGNNDVDLKLNPLYLFPCIQRRGQFFNAINKTPPFDLMCGTLWSILLSQQKARGSSMFRSSELCLSMLPSVSTIISAIKVKQFYYNQNCWVSHLIYQTEEPISTLVPLDIA